MGTIDSYNLGSNEGGRVFSSLDGTTWAEVAASPLINSNRVELAVSSDVAHPDKMYALTEGTTTEGPHIYATTDAFSTVTELAKPNDADTSIPSNDFTNGQDFYDLEIEVDPTNDDVVYVGGIDLFRTDQGANTNLSSEWKQISKWSESPNLNTLSCSYVHADQQAFTFRPGANNQAVIGCDGGVFYASDLSVAATTDVFTEMNTNYNVTQFYYGGYGQNTSNELIVAGAQDNGSQFINGASTGVNSSDMVNGGDGAYSTIDKDGNYMVVSYVYSNHTYFKLPYDGTSYDIDTNNNEGDFISQAGLDHNLNIMYSNGSSGATKQINRYVLATSSATKTQLINALLDGSPTAFKVSPYTTSSTTLLVGIDNGKLLKLTNANGVANNIVWENITGSSFIGSISDIEYGATENDIFVTFHNYGVTNIWSSSDGGVNWNNKEGNLPDMPVKCILQNPLVPNEVIIGTELGVWSTTNFNTTSPTWLSSTNGMRDVKVLDLDLRTADNSILATTFGRGLFTGKFTDKAFLFSIANNTVNVCKPNDAIFNINFNTLSSYNTVTTFSATGIPTGASASFSPTSLATEGVFSMTVSNIGSLVVGEYPITIIGTGNETNSIDVILKVLDNSLGIITPTNPINNATGVEISNTVFSWNSDLNATSYDFELAEDAGFNTIIESTNVTTDSYTSTSILKRAKVYYWRIRAKNDCITSNYSATQNFQTDINCIQTSNSTSYAIPDGLGANSPGDQSTSIIHIPDNVTVTDVNATINISHTWIGDLVVSLISPANTEIVLFNRGCDSGRVQGINVTYDDAASTIISCSTSLSGTYIPDNPLSGFNGENSLGDWTLKVVDYYNGDVGTINSWTLNICQTITATNPNLTNNIMNVGTNSTYTIKQTDIEATSSDSTANQQNFMVTEIPQKGVLKLSGINLTVGNTFTQDDINTGKVSYSNTSSISALDHFKVDITNATGGFLPDQQINFNIDSALAVDDAFFNKTGILVFPTVSNGNFNVQSQSYIGKTEVELYNISGQRVYKTNLDFNSFGLKQINANHLSSGVYILKISSDNLQGSKKIIIKQ
jgi:subtilisin-like proprotein convertase family protein